MNNELKTGPISHDSVSLRPERPEDEAFLLEAYASTRQEELDLTGWNAATREAFVKMQFTAMRQGYAGMFPLGEFSVILLNQRPVGRIVISRADVEFRVVDMVVLPAFRGQGVGTFLLRELLAEAAQAGKPVRLHVLKMSRATGLYERLGFLRVGEEGFYDHMEWRPIA
jgi:ribosomal protein S18 acetylase RimI-like enzyme